MSAFDSFMAEWRAKIRMAGDTTPSRVTRDIKNCPENGLLLTNCQDEDMVRFGPPLDI